MRSIPMKQYFTDKKTGISYTLQGDYYLPELALPTQQEEPIGIWGQRHLRYIKQNRKILYTDLLTGGKLNSYLADVNEQAENLFFRLVKELAEKEGVTEELKAHDQMEWAGRMNNIRARAKEIVVNDIICK